MKIILVIILFAFPFAGIAQSNQMLIESHLVKFKNAKTYTLAIAEKLDEDKFDFKPVKEEMTFREQVLHITQNMYWLSSTYLNGESLGLKIKDEGQSIQDIKSQYLEIGKYTLKVLQNLEENELSERVNFFAGNLTRWQIFELMHDHHTHHRGQIIVYLRLNGFKPPKYVGW